MKKIRNKQERKEFLREQDGWTEFELEDVKMFGKIIRMTKCVKCGSTMSLRKLHTYLSPLHCIGCGRTTLEQDRNTIYKLEE